MVTGDQQAAVAQVFDRAAATYDNVGVELFKPIARRPVGELAPQRGERALDVGCGRGAALFPLAQAVGPEGFVLGIDLSTAMVEATAAEAAALDLSVEVRVGDAQARDLPPESFDVMASSLVLFILPDPRAALAAWRSLLAPRARGGSSSACLRTT